MATWKKWVIRVVIGLIVLAGVLFGLLVFALDRLADDMCGTTIYDRAISPDGNNQAVVFEVDCGATTGFNRHVSIVSSGTNLQERNPELPEGFLALRGAHEIKLNWLAVDRLEVHYPIDAETFRIESKSKGVAIEYKKSR